MKTKHTLTLVFLFLTSLLSAQTLFRGAVVDAQSKQPIPSVKIGITNQGVGVITDAAGKYNYKKYQETLSDADKLVVSGVGYETIELGAAEVRTLFNRNSTIELEKSAKMAATPPIKKVTVFWDISEGLQERTLNRELTAVQQFLDAQGAISVTLQVFNSAIVTTEVWKRWDGDMERFRESVTKKTYNGPSNYSVLLLDKADAVLLVSNGEPNYGKLAVSQDQPVYVVSSIKTKEGVEYLKALTEYTSGSLLQEAPALAKRTQQTATQKRLSSPNTITGTITSLGKPVQGATLMIKGDLAEYTTAADGTFNLPASEGAILSVRALGMFSKGVAVKDADTLRIELLPSSDQLDEVVLTEKVEKIVVGNKEMDGIKVPHVAGGVTVMGDFYITADDIVPDAKTLEQVLRENFAGIALSQDPYKGPTITIRGNRPSWILNGVLLIHQPPPLYLSDKDIESIVVKEPNYETARYGEPLAGDAIIVTTKATPLSRAKRVNSALVKGNEYTDKVASIDAQKNLITGTVSGPKGPLQGAEVLRKGSFDVAQTKADGSFTLNASDGDIIIVSGLGLFSKEVAVSDKKKYDIQLLTNKNYLNEVVVTGVERKLPKNKAQETFGYGPELDTGRYTLKGFGSFNVTTITKEDHFFEQYPDLTTALFGRFESLFIDKRSPGVLNGRPYILRGWKQEYVQLFVDGQLEVGSVDKISPAEIVSISIKSDKAGIMPPALLIDTNRSGFSKEQQSALVKENDYIEEVKEVATIQQITGIITGPKGPLKDASITKKGSFNEVSSDTNGSFLIKAAIDEILVISASGMFSKELLIESQNVGTIALTAKTNDLEATVLEGEERVDNTVETAEGKINADKLGYTTETLGENDFSSGYTNLRQLITGKVAGVDVAGGLYSGSDVAYKIRGGSQSINTEKAPIWIINGTPYPDPPNFLDVQQIKSITVLKSTMATSRYGSLASGGAFLIKTKEADFKNKAAASNKSALVSGNEYAGDVTGSMDTALPSYIIRFRESGTPQQQLALYKKLSRTQESPLEYYVDAAQYFQSLSPALGDEVRSDLAYIARNNTKALRTLAYLYELVQDTQNTVLVNERIAKIAPQEAQSYRDLALAYQNNRQFDKALELYINMLGEQILGVNFDGLEKPLRSELSRLVALHKDKIDFSRLPNEWLRTDFKRDMRMVIDWSDRSVPFEFQFVNPDKKFFKWTHSLEETRDRLEAEQKQGFQTEEFIIDDAPAGEWIINIQYLGDEGDYVLPPFLKYTLYRDYGTPQETKEVRVIKLFKQVDKVTLGRVTM